MMTKHKHYELIKAWAEGAEIQVKSKDKDWMDILQPFWAADREYRIKPEKKVVEYRLYETSIGVIVCCMSGNKATQAYIESCGNFKRWITDTLRIEIDV